MLFFFTNNAFATCYKSKTNVPETHIVGAINFTCGVHVDTWTSGDSDCHRHYGAIKIWDGCERRSYDFPAIQRPCRRSLIYNKNYSETGPSYENNWRQYNLASTFSDLDVTFIYISDSGSAKWSVESPISPGQDIGTGLVPLDLILNFAINISSATYHTARKFEINGRYCHCSHRTYTYIDDQGNQRVEREILNTGTEINKVVVGCGGGEPEEPSDGSISIEDNLTPQNNLRD